MRIGIDLGGTTVKAAICTEQGQLLHKDSLPTRTGDPEGLKEDMKTLALRLCALQGCQPSEVSSIGIGIPGSFDKAGCRLVFGTNLGMNDVYFGDTFVPDFACAVQLDNDANCAALGEGIGGAGQDVDSMLMVTLGTGVGGGIVVGGKLYTGCNGIAGELGHMVIVQDGEPCNCGRKGCLEAYASAGHFVKFAERALAEGCESSLQAHAGKLDAKKICDAVDQSDALATHLFTVYCDHLACGLANFINIFQPSCIVIGGGLAGYGEKLLAPLRTRIEHQTFRGTPNTELRIARLGNDAGLVGAAML